MQLDHSNPVEDEKISLRDLFATVGQVASVVGGCGLLNAFL